MVLYVDDVLIAGSNKDVIVELKKKLSSEFEMTDLGELSHFLGIKVDYDKDNGEMNLSQKVAIKELLETFKMTDCNPVKTPLEPGLVLKKNETNENATKFPYRELIGKLMYIMLATRPDLCHAVSYLSRFQDNPNDEHWQNAKRVLRYLKGSSNEKLFFCRNETEPVLEAFSDSDYANDIGDRKSTSGHILKVFGSTVMWSSKKQQTIALSSTEAEYVAMAAATQDVMWLKGLLNDMKIETDAIPIYEDNQGAIFMAKNLECKRVKHIDVKFHFIREKIQAKVINIQHISTQLQQADMMTKSLPRMRFEELKKLIGLASRGGVED